MNINENEIHSKPIPNLPLKNSDQSQVVDEVILTVENENHEKSEIHVPVFDENLERKYRDVFFAILFIIVFIAVFIYGKLLKILKTKKFSIVFFSQEFMV